MTKDYEKFCKLFNLEFISINKHLKARSITGNVIIISRQRVKDAMNNPIRYQKYITNLSNIEQRHSTIQPSTKAA